MLNQCNFIGRLGNDPDMRYSKDGLPIANISVACSEKYKDKETTEWVRGTAFGKLAEIIGEYLKKGSLVFISGKMKTDKYEADGVTKYSTSIIINEMKMLGGDRGNSQTGSTQNSSPPAQQASKPASDDFTDDDIPF